MKGKIHSPVLFKKGIILILIIIFGSVLPLTARQLDLSGADTNENGVIDDEELLVIINWWAEQRLISAPAPTMTPTPDTQQTPTPTPTPTYDSETIIITLPGDVPLELVKIPEGDGIVNGETVHVSEFWIGKYEVTQSQWEAVMGNNPSSNKGNDKPVEQITWDDCHLFTDALNALTHVPYVQATWRFTLPSYTQWEYACRADTATDYFWGDDDSLAVIYSWYSVNSDSHTHDVGTRESNPWNLYDMTGNVSEWCEDMYDTGQYFVSGGSIYDGTSSLRSDSHSVASGYQKFIKIGFRVARTQLLLE